MTAVVGILCSDGAVIGTDSSSTMVGAGGVRTIEQHTDKLDILESRIIIAGTGSVGHGQRFRAIMSDLWEKKVIKGERDPIGLCVDISSATIANFVKTQSSVETYGALVALPVERGPVLCEFTVQRFQPELKTAQMWWCSMGSTQPITDPFLALLRSIFWPTNQPTVREATLAVTWALDHAIMLNPGGVNGPARIAVLERTKGKFQASLLTDADLTEHRTWIEGAKRAMAQTLQTAEGPDVPRLGQSQ